SIPVLVGDEEQLIQALLNIVRNAMQSLDNPQVNHDIGSILLRTRVVRNVTFAGTFHRLAVNIEIIDNGPGIPDGMLESIFYPMISGRANGSGLGLSIANAIFNQHKGFIECESEPGNTCFSLMLPIEQATEELRRNE
ncbi:MAG: ATP-binding protein, partial [Gimesia chilikensis]